MSLPCASASHKRVSLAAAVGNARDGAAGRVALDDPFGQLPLVAPGQHSGRIAYLSRLGCQLREFDLATGVDAARSGGPLCEGGSVVAIAPDGNSVAERLYRRGVQITRADGTRTVIGGRLPSGKPPGNFVERPTFLAGGRKIAFCTYSKRAMATVVADTATGRVHSRVAGTCEVAFTTRGPLALRGRRVMLGRRTILRFDGWVPANRYPGNPPLGNPLASTPSGTYVALAVRKAGGYSDHVAILVFRPDGRGLRRYEGKSDISISFQAVAPHGKSAVVWWGDILQLAPLGVRPGRFALHYHTGHSTDEAHAISPVGYSPDGRYAVMPRQKHVPLRGGGPAPPTPAIILDGRTLQPLYQVPIDAQLAVWLP